MKAAYDRLLADIDYRMEDSALLDTTTVTATRQSETALALWSDVTARTSDEAVIHHAAGAARLANSTNSEAKQAAAHAPVVSILRRAQDQLSTRPRHHAQGYHRPAGHRPDPMT